MSTTRQKQGQAEREQPNAGDYFVVDTRREWFYVSAATAVRLADALERRWLPRWIKFVDLNGARVWLRTSVIEGIRESTERQRARDREFQYLQRKEERTDKRWDDDE